MGRNESTRSELKPGDHIYSDKGEIDIVIAKLNVYNHHGIYVGDGIVIHFLAPAKQSNSSVPCKRCGHTPRLHYGIVRTCVDCFLDGHSLYINYWGDCKPPYEVVKTAMEFCDGIRSFGEYELLNNNCEHFATFCKTGKKSSKEIKAAVIKITQAGCIGALGLLEYARQVLKTKESPVTLEHRA
ncbi:protein LEAD-SENSITIVE 1-like [Mangifera indica]|uniref:protein LEAD-SENSITIVE 1-like n=1 Tax=Mangifera indica TaxID=29780 RepID=UPI001CFA639C|nr:protein LEAD-SENSITIVE 1-like [Mangifera indica]